MTKQQILKGLENNILASNDLLEVLKLVSKKAETLTHYQKIDGRYIAQLNSVIPCTGMNYVESEQQSKPYKEYWTKEGYKSFSGELTCIELVAYRMYKDKYFTRVSDVKHYYNARYEQTRRIGAGLKAYEVTPANIIEGFKGAIETLTLEIKRMEDDKKAFNDIVQFYNNAMKTIKSFSYKQDKYSHITKSLMPELKLPYIHESDLIS